MEKVWINKQTIHTLFLTLPPVLAKPVEIAPGIKHVTFTPNVIKLSQGADVTESLVEKLGSFFLPSECADSCNSCFSNQIGRYGNLT